MRDQIPRKQGGQAFGVIPPDGKLRLTARDAADLNRLIDEINRLGKLAVAQNCGLDIKDEPSGRTLSLGVDFPEGSFPALLSGATSPYAFVEVAGGPNGTWLVKSGGRSGEKMAYEVAGVAGLDGVYARLYPVLGGAAPHYRFRHWRIGTGDPCPDGTATICATCYDVAACCTVPWVGTTNPCVSTPTTVAAGATVTIERLSVPLGGPFACGTVDADYPPLTATADASGVACITIPVSVADPATAPTVDPAGGGATGGALQVAAYNAAYTWATAYGETRPSPASGEFQVGVPDPNAYPVADTLGVDGDFGTSGGSLPVGRYFAEFTFADANGNETLPNSAAAVFDSGIPDPVAGHIHDLGHTTGGTNPLNGPYRVAYTVVGPSGETALSPDWVAFTVDGTQTQSISIDATDVFFKPLYYNGDSFTLYLSDDAGATWHRYETGVPGGTHALTAAFNPTGVAPPAASTSGPTIPRATLPGLASRPNAAEQRIYLAAPGGSYHLYAEGIAGTTYDLAGAPNPAGAAPPVANATDRNIPSLTFPTPLSAHVTAARVYLFQGDPAGGHYRRYLDAAASPVDLDLAFDGGAATAPVTNTTHLGVYRVRTWEDDGSSCCEWMPHVDIADLCFHADVDVYNHTVSAGAGEVCTPCCPDPLPDTLYGTAPGGEAITLGYDPAYGGWVACGEFRSMQGAVFLNRCCAPPAADALTDTIAMRIIARCAPPGQLASGVCSDVSWSVEYQYPACNGVASGGFSCDEMGTCSTWRGGSPAFCTTAFDTITCGSYGSPQPATLARDFMAGVTSAGGCGDAVAFSTSNGPLGMAGNDGSWVFSS